MSDFRKVVDDSFYRIGLRIYDNPKKVLILVFILISILGYFAPKIVINTSTESFLHDTDPTLLSYEKFRDQFGRDDMIIIALHPKNVFDIEFLKVLKTLHEDLENNVPLVAEVTSLINARNTRGDGDTLIVEKLFETFPESENELETIKKRAIDNELYKNLLLSEDQRFTTIIIRTSCYSGDITEGNELGDFVDGTEPAGIINDGSPKKYLTDSENNKVIREIEKIVKKYDLDNAEVHIAGSPVVADYLKRSMVRDMKTYLRIAILTIVILLFIMFRRISGIVMPIVIILLTLLSTIGVMASQGTELKLSAQILPSFLLAVGVADSVHVLALFYRHLNQSGNKKDAILYAFSRSGLAIFMTSITTTVGLLSFSTAEVAPVADIGVYCAIGIMFALFYTILLIPAFIAIFPVQAKKALQQNSDTLAFDHRVFNKIANLTTTRPYMVITLFLAIVVICLYGASQIKIEHVHMKWLPEDNPARAGNELIDAELKGSTSLEVVVDTQSENGILNPDILNGLDKSTEVFGQYNAKEFSAGKAWSITTVLKETNQALHENDPAYYSIPQDRDLIAQEFLLFENSGSDDLEKYTDSLFSKARFTIKVPFVDAMAYTDFITDVKMHFISMFPDAKIEITGLVPLVAGVISSAIKSMQKSYLYTIIVISFMMILLIGNIKIGVISMIPNLTPVVGMLGIMGWLGLPMDLFSMFVGSIAIGLSVDDTIHFMHHFNKYYEETGTVKISVEETLKTAGRAMSVTSITLSLAFFMFMLSDMNNISNFGLLTGITIIMAWLSDFFLAPALMAIAVKDNKSAELYSEQELVTT